MTQTKTDIPPVGPERDRAVAEALGLESPFMQGWHEGDIMPQYSTDPIAAFRLVLFIEEQLGWRWKRMRMTNLSSPIQWEAWVPHAGNPTIVTQHTGVGLSDADAVTRAVLEAVDG